MGKEEKISKKSSRRYARRVLCMAAAGTILFAACGKEKGQQVSGEQTQEEQAERESVHLTVWGAEEDASLLAEITDSFREEYQSQADIQITYSAQGESDCKNALLGGLEEGADVFTFADDQLPALAAAGALEPVEQADVLRTEHLPKAVEAASVGSEMYAYPLTADNGYFLYYNKEFFSEDDILSLVNIWRWTGRLPGMYMLFSEIPEWKRD